jgi:hypothetical protein
MVEHIVLYQLRPDADPGALGDALGSLAAVEEVAQLHHGPNTSPLGLSGPWDYGLHVQFRDEQARERYMVDSRHLAVVPIVEDLTSSLLVFGITTDESPKP